MKLDKFGRFVDIWDHILNLVKPVKEPVKPEPVRLVERKNDGSFDMTLIRNGKKGHARGFGYNKVHAKALLDLEEKENAS